MYSAESDYCQDYMNLSWYRREICFQKWQIFIKLSGICNINHQCWYALKSSFHKEFKYGNIYLDMTNIVEDMTNRETARMKWNHFYKSWSGQLDFAGHQIFFAQFFISRLYPTFPPGSILKFKKKFFSAHPSNHANHFVRSP